MVLLGSNFEASIKKTIFRLPAHVVADYEDTADGRNVVQAAVTFEELPVLTELYGPAPGVNEPQEDCG